MKQELFNIILEALAEIKDVRLEDECDILEDLCNCINLND